MTEERATLMPAAAASKVFWLAATLLVALTVWVFAPVSGFEFLAWDDDRLITGQPMVSQGLNAETLRWALTGVVDGIWVPVAWLSHLVDVSLYGLDAGGHHVTSLVFHVANAVLLFLGLVWLTASRGRSLVVAALFAVHPLHVESVAWVSERRDVLSLFFALLAIGAHARWARSRERWAYLACLVALGLGLASKSMLVSMPLLLLLVDHWPLRRSAEGVPRLLLEKLPHAMLVAVFVATTLGTQRVVPMAALPLDERISNAIASYWVYLGQTLWPRGLAVMYPHPSLPGGPEPASVLASVAGALLLAAVTGLALAMRRRPYLATGWLWYVVSLVPVLGLLQVSQHAHADRYTYLPLVGIFVAASWGVGEVVERFGRGRAGPARAAAGAALLAVGACALLAREQVGHWRDTVSLFEQAIRVAEGNFQMHYNLGIALEERGDIESAIEHYRRAVSIHPGMSRAHDNLAKNLRRQGRLDEAIRHYEFAADSDPNTAAVKGLAAAAHERDGNLDALVDYLERRVVARPDSVPDRINLGDAQRMNSNPEAAAAAYRAAAALEPDNAALREAMMEAERALGGPGAGR